MPRFGGLAAVLLLLLVISGCSKSDARSPQAVAGVLDLTGAALQRTCWANLAGEWRYFPGKLIEPAAAMQAGGSRVQIPHIWGDEVSGNGKGVASYALRVALPEQVDALALGLGTVSSSVQVFADGRPIATVGRVSADPSAAAPRYEPGVFDLPRGADHLELVFHVSNYSHPRGGLWEAPWIGTVDCLSQQSKARLGLTVFLLTAVGVVGLYHLLLWLLLYQDRAAFTVSIIAGLICVRVLVTDERYVLNLFENFPWSLMVRLEYATLAGIVIMSWRFLGQVYPLDVTRRWVQAGTWPSAFYLLLIAVSPVYVFTWLLPVFQAVLVVYIGLAPWLAWLVVSRGREGGWIYLVGISIMCALMLQDVVMFAFNSLPLFELMGGRVSLMPIGYALMAFTQAGILAQRTALASQELSEARDRLDQYARELEHKVAERTAELEAANDQLSHLARVDGLTELGNRRSFDEELAEMWSEQRRRGTPLGLLLIDVDQFKHFNDSYGHQQGDEALRKVARALRDAVKRPRDKLFRYGGEELTVLLPDTHLDGASLLGESMRAAVQALAVRHAGSQHGVLTISVGVAVIVPAAGMEPEALVKAADAALYEAKANGRNCVMRSSLKPAASN